MVSKWFWFGLVLLLLPLSLSYSDVSDEEIIEALTEISTQLQTASTEQAKISEELEKTQNAQSDISARLAIVADEQLPAIAGRVQSLKDSFAEYKANKTREDFIQWGLILLALVAGVIGLAT